jgi:hypothetical protein
MKLRTLVFAGLMTLAMAGSASAQTFTISKSVIGAGGLPMSGGTFSMNGTIGQPAIGPVSGGNFTVNQGFWYTLGPGPNVGVKPLSGSAAGYELAQNFPNPFNPSTLIRFSLPVGQKVTIRVMNLLGEEVARVLDEEWKDAGNWEVDFVAENIPSGTYVYRIEAGSFTASKKMVLMK